MLGRESGAVAWDRAPSRAQPFAPAERKPGAYWLHDRPRGTADSVRTGRVLDRCRHCRHHGRVVADGRNLFCIPRRCSSRPPRPTGRAAIRLRRPHRRTAGPARSHRQPAIARSGTIRAKARRPVAPSRNVGVASRGFDQAADPLTTGSIRPSVRGGSEADGEYRHPAATASRSSTPTGCRQIVKSARAATWPRNSHAQKPLLSMSNDTNRRRLRKSRSVMRAKPANCGTCSPISG